MFDMPQWVLTLFSIIVGAGGLVTAFVALRADVRKAPIERSAAQIADAVAVSSAAAGLTQMVFERLQKQDERAEAQDKRIQELNNQINSLTYQVEKVRHSWTAWYLDLKEDWDFHRTQEEAPPPPVTE